MMMTAFLLSMFFILYVRGYSSVSSPEDELIQVFHVCQGGTVYIPWPIDFIGRATRDRPKVTMTFLERDSRRKRLIFTYPGKKKEVEFVDRRFKHRVVFSKEHSGVFITDITIRIQGLYITETKVGDLVWTTKTDIVLHMRPFIKDNRLTMSIIDTNHPKDRKDCMTVECGRVDNEGYPPVSVLWKHNGTVLHKDLVTKSLWWSTYEVCPPFHGTLVCTVGGYTATCNFDARASIDLDLPGTGVVTGSTSPTSDTILMIVIPVLAIGIPLVILGLWMCVHLCRTPRHRRDHNKHNNTPSANNSLVDHNHVNQNHPSNFIAMDHANLPPFISPSRPPIKVVTYHRSLSNFSSQHDLPPPILEDLNEESESIATIETSNRLIGLHSPPKQYRDPEETDKKDSAMFKDEMDEEEEEDEEGGNGNDDDDDDEEEEDSDEDSEDDDDDDEDEDDGEEGEEEEDHDVDQETKEKQPLMEDSIHPIVL